MLVDGIVTVVQESRFQLVDESGVARLVSLDAHCMAEPDQLVALAASQARVRVDCEPAEGTIGLRARSIRTL